jgi:ATP:ADP antiporter, AAA family
MNQTTSDFGSIRSYLWPIYSHECRKIIPMMIILFLICFDYSILRNVKDTIIVTAKSSGVEVIPFIKVWVLLPMAVLFTYIFTKLSNRYSQEKVFYFTISFFLVFFAVFTFIFYPLRESLHPHQLADSMEYFLPAGFKGFITMFRNWTFTLFYVVCELWGSTVLAVLFWGFANEVTKLHEARRFYSMLALVSSLAGICAGFAANSITEGQEWERTLQILISTIIVGGCVTIATFYWMNKQVLTGESFHDLHAPTEKIKEKLSIRESFRYLCNSKYLVCIAVMVLCYNLVVNLGEIVWKDQLKLLHPSAVDYNRYMNYTTSIIGIIASIASLLMSKMMSRFGWTRTALITPIVMLITSVGFFTFMLFRNDIEEPVFYLTGMTPLAIAAFLGATQVCLSKACKYSVFDSTKEMTFIPLSHDSKLKGKAAIDGVGSRLGKSGGSLIHQGLLMFFATVSMSAPYVAVIVIFVIAGWTVAVRSLGHQFAALVGESGRKEIGEGDQQEQKQEQEQMQEG